MNTYKETFETWDKLASLYQEKFMELTLYNTTYDFICSSISKENAEILELGCGPGNITKYLLSKRPDFKILGLDNSPNMINLAKQNNPNANFRVIDVRQIDALTGKFEAIVCGFCLPYLSPSDCEKLILDMESLLNDNGFLYISFVEGDINQAGFEVGSSGYRCYFYYHNLDNLKMQLTNANFTDIHVFKVTYKKSETQTDIHTILTAKKTIIT